MSELSPQAQAILDAYNAGFARPVAVHHKPRIAAALEAVADQVVPYLEEPNWGACDEMRCDIELYTDHQRKRTALLAIAAELEAQ